MPSLTHNCAPHTRWNLLASTKYTWKEVFDYHLVLFRTLCADQNGFRIRLLREMRVERGVPQLFS